MRQSDGSATGLAYSYATAEQPRTVLLLDGPNVADPVPGFEIPPDNGLGVSSAYIVSAENAVLEWMDTSGGGKSEESLTDFWNPIGQFGFPVDARALYDPVSDKFIVTNSAQDSTGYHFLLAVSEDANPNDGWNFQKFDGLNPQDLIDQPNAATDGTYIYLAGSTDSGQEALVVDGEAGQSGTVLSLGGGGIYKQNAHAGGGDLVFAQNDGTLTVQHIDPATQAIDATSAVDLGPVSSVGEQEFSLPTEGTSTPVDAGDQRIYGNAYSAGSLYCTFEVLPPAGSDAGVPTAHWAKLDVRDPGNVRLVAQGDVSGAQLGPDVGTFDSSVAVNGNGDVIINFTACGPSMAPTDYYVVHQVGSADTAFSAPVEYKASAGPFVDPNAGPFGSVGPVSRWGDYSSAVPDPANPSGFWISGEYGTTPNSWEWGTAIAHVLVAPVCFARGTRIATPAGSVSVEDLRGGDIVVTASGENRRITWIGRRRIDCARHPDPRQVWPVRIQADAFGPGLPARDLHVSPQHAIFDEGVLIPARLLVNGRTVTQEPMASIEYFHVELQQHDILLAEGLPAESYLDTGDRATFENGGEAMILHPDFSRWAWDGRACAELKVVGPEIEAVRGKLAGWAAATHNEEAAPLRRATRAVTLPAP